MQHRQEMGQRLKELRRHNKFSQQFVAEHLYITQAAYSLIENSQNGIVSEHIVGLSKLYEVTTDYILTGDKHLVRLSPSQGFMPYYQVKAQAGYIRNGHENLDEEEYEWFKIPGYNPTQDYSLFEVEGSSMVPTVLPGDVVICQKQPNWKTILDGSVVLVVTKESVLVKRFRLDNSKDEFVFVNDNPDENETIRLNKSDIQEIFMIRGKISNVLIPHHQMTSRGKIQNLEESIEFLKKELFSINKKLTALRR